MSRIPRAAEEAHRRVMALVDAHHRGENLTLPQREEIVENYREDAQHLNGAAGAFFTPLGLARDFALHIPDGARVLDLCAGIGVLSWAIGLRDHARGREGASSIVCVEQNRDYLRVGQALLGEATWIQADAFDLDRYAHLGPFDCVIANPPFGRVKTGDPSRLGLRYQGGLFELQIVELAARISRYGVFILPQESSPFRYSGRRSLEWTEGGRAARFTKETGIRLRPNVGVDCEVYRNDWHGAAPKVEIVVYDPEEE